MLLDDDAPDMPVVVMTPIAEMQEIIGIVTAFDLL